MGDPARFVEESFDRSPHRWRSGGFADLLSLAEVDAALTGGGLRFPAVRLVRDGEVLDPKGYTRRARTGATAFSDLLDAPRALDLFAEGATVVLQSLQRWWPALARFSRGLELALGHQVQVNAYLTPSGAAGLAPHHDTHDVFVLQVEGAKHWTVGEPVLPLPLPRHRSDHAAAAGQPTVLELEMSAGDALYLPRGYVHSARAQEGVSLHLTVGILATTVHDVLRRLVDRAADDERFRRSLPVGWADDGALAVGAVKSAVAELIRWLELVDPEPVASALQERFWSRRPQVLGGQLLELVALDRLDDSTPVRRRPGAICRISLDGERVLVVLGDRRVELPAATEPAIRLLVDGGTHRGADLADRFDVTSRLVLVRRLVREGLLVTAADA